MVAIHDPVLRPTVVVTDLAPDGSAWPKDWVKLIEDAIHALPGRVQTDQVDAQARSFAVATIYFPQGEYAFSRSLRIPVDVPVRLIGVHPALSRIRLMTSVVQNPADFDPIMPNASSVPSLPPPYLPPQYRASSDGPNATLFTGGVKPNSLWVVPGTTLEWEGLWSKYFSYVDSHYAVYFTGLRRAQKVIAAPTLQLTEEMFTGGGWGAWVARKLLDAGDGDSPWGVENLGFVGGGLLVAGNGATSWGGGGQRYGAVERCDFEDTVAWGIAVEDQRVVNVNIKDSRFTRCAGGVGIRYAQCDLWTIEDCDFHQTRGIDVLIASASVVVEGCRFTGREAKWAAQPFVHIRTLPAVNELPGAAYAGSVAKVDEAKSAFQAEAWPGATHAGRGVRVIDCTFGTDGWCPETMIQVGPSKQRPTPTPPEGTPAFPLLKLARIPLSPTIAAADGRTVSSVQWAPPEGTKDANPARESVGLHCEGCRFGSVTLPGGAVAPRSAFRFDTSVQDCTIVRAMVGRMTWFIHEAMQEAVWEVCFAAAKNKDNIFSTQLEKYNALEQLVAMNWGNTLEVLPIIGEAPPPAMEPFSLGGRGWDTSGEATSLLAGRGRFQGCGNLISFLDFFRGSKQPEAADAQATFHSNAQLSISPLKVADPSFLSSFVPRIFLPLSLPSLGLASGVTDGKPIHVPLLLLNFEVRSDNPVVEFAVRVGLGAFALAGSRAQRFRAGSDWQNVRLLVPPFSPPSGSQDLSAFDAWTQDGGFVAANAGHFRFPSVSFFVRSRSEVGENGRIELRRMRLTVGSEDGPWLPLGHPMTFPKPDGVADENPNGRTLNGWHLEPLGSQSIGFGGVPFRDGLPDVVEVTHPNSTDPVTFTGELDGQIFSPFGVVEDA
ncbi:MAG: right-handed parallel beta-helix repeat-containing protein [Myxococcales bacterium]|nr:right-handed parallel beta-helix repeat-containing protein [Myxococcales bacterium]